MPTLRRTGALCAFALAVTLRPASGQTLSRELSVDAEDLTSKLVSLAEAIPEGEYGWSPAPGVRSVGSVIGHVAGASVVILARGGATVPESIDPAWYESPEGIGGKEELVVALRACMAFVEDAVAAASDAELERSVPMLGRESTYRATLVFALAHAHEHLGQLIAYARMRGVRPPWSG